MFAYEPDQLEERPYGFVLVRVFVSDNMVPQKVINPLEIDEISRLVTSRDRVVVRLRNGTSYRLFSINYKDFADMVDAAMRERERLVPKNE